MSSLSLVLPYIVVDQNTLQSEECLWPALGDAIRIGGAVLLPDVAMVEMTKGRKWEYATRRSLKILSRCPDRVVIAHGVGELMRRERDAGRPLLDLVDQEVTTSFRSLLRDIQNGAGPTLDRLLSAVPQHQQMAERQHLDHEGNKKQVKKVATLWRKFLSDKRRQELRRGNVKLFRELLASKMFTRVIEQSLVGADFPPDAAKLLAEERSMASHAFLCHAALALRWVADGGLESAKPATVTNDLIDMAYLLMGSFCIRVLSQEKKVMAMQDHLLAVAALREDHRCRPARFGGGA